MESDHKVAAAILAVAILNNQADKPNGRPTVLKGKPYEERLIETFFQVLKSICAS